MQNSCSVGEEEISAVPQPYASHVIPDPVIDHPINGSPSDNANIKPSERSLQKWNPSLLKKVNRYLLTKDTSQERTKGKIHSGSSNQYEAVIPPSPQPWSSPCPICDGIHGNYGLHGSW
ncbi:2971_t:CDS:2 [Acaulospora colombiana]|uniref:2971_t:CDS:1 n=1 Tax=Acaulospora colombiana TaxID=27376 RepID=A0ACA9LQ13_9GLOM|nr:2971_t:CDS:2 [Acaulospora colombiana]